MKESIKMKIWMYESNDPFGYHKDMRLVRVVEKLFCDYSEVLDYVLNMIRKHEAQVEAFYPVEAEHESYIAISYNEKPDRHIRLEIITEDS